MIIIKQAIAMLKSRVGDKLYFGVISFNFEAGKITWAKETRTFKSMK